MKIKNLLIAAALGMGVCFTSCNEGSDGDEPLYSVFTDFATLQEMSSPFTTLTLREKDDSPLITLTTQQTFPPEIFKDGMRVVITYAPDCGLHYVSGPAVIYEAIIAEGLGGPGTKGTADSTNDWSSDTFTMKSINRAGTYIDFIFSAYTAVNNKKVEFILDEATADSELPEYHIVYKGDYVNKADNYVFYCSYNVDDPWANPATKGVRIYYPETGGEKYIDFLKNDNNGK